MEVVVSAVADKFNISRRVSAITVGGAMGVLSCFLFSTSAGLVTLDIMDKFTNNLGIVFGAICALVVVGWVTGRRREIQQHLNAVSQFKVGGFWQFLTFIATPLLLVYFLVNEIITIVREGYEGYSSTQIGLYGWTVLGVILLASFIMPLVDFRGNKYLDGIETSDYGVPVGGRPAGTPNPLAAGNAAAPNTDDK